MHAHDEAGLGRPGRYFRYGFAILFLLVAAVVVVSFVAALFFAPAEGVRPFFFPFWFPFGFLFLLFFLFFVGRLFFLPRRWAWGRPPWLDRPGAVEILRRRYASGELSKEEYERMTRDLESGRLVGRA
ncbi:MAG: SHOCT domain-containing protein [Thermoplasmata archaeon]|nr:SHOCT domain-containing protein [Thermoplasmata archaeon]